ncbi:fimbrial biogenesis outer membrane usher protein [Scandinavium sp. TWS1a]|uniref:fimbria/pilus outer membrane usher protein n=1 Tax=Scandinavium tedordense TaxID=2926521 RepID=UPI0021662BBC|nr:fimbria/pilus outer membrane usher protein [Scandinavium tedordense]MCS2169599.1 fimbrial biogenesis outer membrane usher protein [Scandinavium tedordense]
MKDNITIPLFKPLISCIVLAIMTHSAQATDSTESADQASSTTDGTQFDPIFLKTSGQGDVDLSRFQNGAATLPGTYPVDIYVNGQPVTKGTVKFVEVAKNDAEPCLDYKIIEKLNLKKNTLSSQFQNSLKEKKQCYFISRELPDSNIDYDSGEQRLNITVPQSMVNNEARGYVDPSLWDEGIPALFLGYNASTYTTRSHGKSYNSAYAGINAGLNIGPWYFRHDGNYNWQDEQGGKYESINNYVQRDIPQIKGQLRLGESNTRGEVFDSLPYKGMEIVSDDRMLPQSQRGFAPDIRGIARTNAKVSVKQNGRIIYETTVTPGAFDINDLYPTGYGGDLDVTVTEADGSTQNFLVPYTSVAQLIRPGNHKFDFVVGQLNDKNLSFDPFMYQLSWQQGLTNYLTGYAGLQSGGEDTPDYYALLVGAAVNTGIGAFSFDVTQARVHLDDADGNASSGQSYQVSFSKYLAETRSNLTIAAYRYSTAGYYDFSTAMQALDIEKNHGDMDNLWRPRNKVNLTLNQSLSDGYGQVYVTGFSQDYWNNGDTDLQYQIGYSNSWKRISYNLNAGRVRNQYGDMETNWQININVPLGDYVDSNVPMLTAGVNHDSNGRTGEQVGISGTAGTDSQYGYGVTASNYNHGGDSSIAMNGNVRTQYTNLTATYGAGDDYQNASLGMSGTVLAWRHGVTFTPYTGDNFAIVEADGATGAKVSGYSNVRIDPWGHAAVPYLNPYEVNDITIDPHGIPDTVEMENTSEKVAPYDGAVTRIVFSTKSGTPILVTAHSEGGVPVPFGAEVSDSSGHSVGSVGQAGVIYARVSEQHGFLKVHWGTGPDSSCNIHYILAPMIKDRMTADIQRFNSICRSGS